MDGLAIYNVRNFGATGNKEQPARQAIQAAVDAAAAAGGGVVYFPPGQYTSGTIHLRSNVRIYIEAGATVYSSKVREDFDKHGLFYGEDVEHITIEGRGTVDGQATYDWSVSTYRDWYIYPNEVRWTKAGRQLYRPFPAKNQYGNLILLIRCKDVRIANLSLVRSPSWVIHPWQCDHLVIEGIYLQTSLKEGVWADGIDPDGCRDVRIANCTIEAGDDALVFYSSACFGPPRPCENITVTNCRLSSASSALKFCDGNLTAIRNVTIDNCVITDSNRGIAFMSFDGGLIENVVIANVTVNCRRFDWFWWGDSDPIHFNLIKRSEMCPDIDKAKEPPIGAMRNITLRNIYGRGLGANLIHGHETSLLENIVLENVNLTVYSDEDSTLQKSSHAMTLENARNVRLRDVQIGWETPCANSWQSTLAVRNVQNLVVEGLSAQAAPNSNGAPAVLLEQPITHGRPFPFDNAVSPVH